MANNTRCRRKMNLPLMMALVLFYLTVFSTYFTAGLYAKYVVTGNASDSARVIKFGQISVTETGAFGTSGGTAYFQPGVNLKKDVTIHFTSAESDVYIFAVAETPGWTINDVNHKEFTLTENSETVMSWKVKNSWQYLTTTTDGRLVYWQYVDSNNEFKDDFIAGNPENSDWNINEGSVTVNALVSYKNYNSLAKKRAEGTLDIEINITAYAVQAGGFENAQGAWDSLNASI